jgi:hypothetical protein
MERVFTPESLILLFQSIESSNLDLILVGGQAINIWASYYANRIPELIEYLPFSSADLDFYGGKVEAIACQKILGGTINLNRDFDPSPNTGVLIVPSEPQALRIDFLGSVFGIGDVELSQSAIVFEGQEHLAGLRVKILNPTLCFEAKLKSTVGLPQEGRQDLKHLKMSLLFVRQYIIDTIENDVRQGLKLIERIVFHTWSDAGLTLWHRFKIEINSVIPTAAEIDTLDVKWETFQKIRLPQIQQETTRKRDKYLQMQIHIEARTKNSVDPNDPDSNSSTD